MMAQVIWFILGYLCGIGSILALIAFEFSRARSKLDKEDAEQ